MPRKSKPETVFDEPDTFEPLPELPTPTLYENISGTTLFTAAGRCHRDTKIKLTPNEVEVFGDKVKPC